MWLLNRHGDVQAFIGRDEVIEILGILANIDLNPVHLPAAVRIHPSTNGRPPSWYAYREVVRFCASVLVDFVLGGHVDLLFDLTSRQNPSGKFYFLLILKGGSLRFDYTLYFTYV